MGVFDKIKQSLTRTTQQFLDRFDEVVTRADAPERRSRQLDVETIDALEEILISADVGVAATGRIVDAVKVQRREGASLRELVKREILGILRSTERTIDETVKPHVVLIVGVNGTGKTTTVGKLARLIKESG